MQSTTRPPTGSERAATNGLYKRLNRLSHPQRNVTRVSRKSPPGRLNIKEAMRLERQQSLGLRETALPFQKKEIVVAPSPIFKVGIACDVSGSMGQAQGPLGVLRYGVGAAVHRLNGTVAAALFGERGIPVQMPHEQPKGVEIFEANYGSQNVGEAFAFLDAALNLLDGDGVRMIVALTDGNFFHQEIQDAEEWAVMLRQANVGLVWVNPAGTAFARPDGYGHGEQLAVPGMTPIEAVRVVGDAIEKQYKWSSAAQMR